MDEPKVRELNARVQASGIGEVHPQAKPPKNPRTLLIAPLREDEPLSLASLRGVVEPWLVEMRLPRAVLVYQGKRYTLRGQA